MLLTSGIELAKALIAPSVGGGTSFIDGASGGGGGVRGGAGDRAGHQRKRSRGKRVFSEAWTEAASLLALARGAIGGNGGKGSREPETRKKNAPHRVRPIMRVHDRLHAWAVKRGRDVSGLKVLLASSADIRLEDAKLIRDRIVHIPSINRRAAQVRTDSPCFEWKGLRNVYSYARSDRDSGSFHATLYIALALRASLPVCPIDVLKTRTAQRIK